MAAVSEVFAILTAAMEAVGVNVVQDRNADDAISQGEGDVVALGWLGATSDLPDNCPCYFWTAQVSIEPWAGVTSTQSPLQRCEALAAQISPVFANDYSFGGKFFDSRFLSVADLSDMTGEYGAFGLIVEIQYQTAKSDITSIST